ncbi:MAG TPA: hypothetical protein VFD20_01170 [Demequina sp.]|nr:hypothetical protein [Demequina sp.]
MIARRFRLVRTEEYDIPGATRFVAYDTRLDQDVTVDIVSSVAPTAVVRAARRAQVVRDRRLTRILAANSERRGGDRLTYVVSERLAGVGLDELLGHVAFLPATAAAIVGEAAAILGVPLRSGTHHGMIRPQSVIVTPRGRVMLSGLGVEGELGSQARLIRGRTERADAIALARLFVTAVTTLDADAVTADDLPADLTDSARDLCEALLRGSGPLTLAQITGALGTGETAGLRALVAEAPTLWWSPAPEVVDSVDVDAAEEIAAPREEVEDAEAADLAAVAEAAAEDDADASLEDAEEDRAVEEPVDPSSTRLRTRFGGAVDDIDEFHDIVAAQNEDSAPSVLEAIFERLHRRFPNSDQLADLAAAAHRRAQTVAPFNIGPLLVAALIVLLFVAVVIGASMITQPIDAPFDGYDNPSQTYPEYTFGQTPPPTPEG